MLSVVNMRIYGQKTAAGLVVALSVAAALVITPAASAAEKACTTTVTTSADGTTHESVTCQTDPTQPDPTNPNADVPQPEWPKTIVTPSCGGPMPAGVEFEYMAFCPQPPCPDGTWDRFVRWVQPAAGAVARFEGTYCADPVAAAPVPVVTPEMVVDAAEQVAPKPVAQVQPGTRSYVNIPNNYFAEAGSTTIPVTVLGQQIQVTFEPSGDTWDFGDGGTATGSGVEDASVGAAGAVEHAYTRQGGYSIQVTRGYTVRFTLPGGPITVAGAFAIPGPDTVLPVGEIQTRVDSTS